MKLFKFLQLSFQSLVYLILLPVLTLIIASMAWLNYDEMYKTILNGFNQKLMAISSTTGSFIDGDEHEELSSAKSIKAFAYGAQDMLYGIDEKNRLIQIDLEDGSGQKLFELYSEINDIAYNPEDDLLYATTKNKIITISTHTAKMTEYYESDSPLQAISYDPVKRMLFVSKGKELIQVDEERKETSIRRLEYGLSSLSYDLYNKTLYAIEEESDTLVSFSFPDLERSRLIYIDFPAESSSLKAIAFHQGKLYAGDNHLMIHDLESRSTAYKDFSRGYRNEKSELYRKYIEPMTEVKLQTDLTYHYTQKLVYNQDDVNCLYILDVHDGNEYTPIGSEDSMDMEDLLGAENVMFRKSIYISKIKQWEQWGLLKVSFAPILNANGEVKAIAGADINMGIIKKKTREALFQAIAVGIISLIIAIVTSYFIAQKIIEPIKRLKYSALRIAAGRYGEKVFIKNPRELSELSNAFNTMDDELKGTISGLRQYNSDIQYHRRAQDLQRELDQKLKIHHPQIRAHLGECSHNIDGLTLFDERLYFWLSTKKETSALEASKKRELIASSLKTFAQHLQNPLDELKSLFDDELDSFGYVDLINSTLVLHAKSKALDFINVDSDKAYAVQTLTEGSLRFNAPLVFSDPSILSELTVEQIDLLIDQKYSNLNFKHCALIFTVLPKVLG